MPIGTKIEKYEKYTGSSYELDSSSTVNGTTVSITEDINLQNTQGALGDSDIRKYRIYFILPEHINVQKDQQYTVEPEIKVEQKINTN